MTSSSEDVSNYENKIISYKIKWRLIKLHKMKIITGLKNKRHIIHWEKLFASDTPGKGLIDMLCKELLDIIKKTKNKCNFFTKYMNVKLIKEGIAMAK